MTAPKRIGPGINARTRTINWLIPRPKEPLLSGIHLGNEVNEIYNLVSGLLWKS
jgi:hypothetical protein